MRSTVRALAPVVDDGDGGWAGSSSTQLERRPVEVGVEDEPVARPGARGEDRVAPRQSSKVPRETAGWLAPGARRPPPRPPRRTRLRAPTGPPAHTVGHRQHAGTERQRHHRRGGRQEAVEELGSHDRHRQQRDAGDHRPDNREHTPPPPQPDLEVGRGTARPYATAASAHATTTSRTRTRLTRRFVLVRWRTASRTTRRVVGSTQSPTWAAPWMSSRISTTPVATTSGRARRAPFRGWARAANATSQASTNSGTARGQRGR